MAQSVAWTLPGTWPAGWQAAPAARRDAASASVDKPQEAVGELTESALVEACLSGRPGAFDLIVERHRRTVYQLCYRFVGNHEDASDLSQDVFLRAYRG